MAVAAEARSLCCACILSLLLAGCSDDVFSSREDAGDSSGEDAGVADTGASRADSSSAGELVIVSENQSLDVKTSLSAVAEDLDGDGLPEVFVVNGEGAWNQLWENENGALLDPAEGSLSQGGVIALTGDLNGDSSTDLLLVKSGFLLVWLNDGAGGLTSVGDAVILPDAQGGDLGDFDSDGDLDLYVGTGSAGVLFMNDGGGQFQRGGDPGGVGNHDTRFVVAADFDGDGNRDVFEANDGPDQVWFGDGTGAFTGSGESLVSGTAWTAASADLDDDGDLDLVVGSADGALVFLNDGAGKFGANAQRLGASEIRTIALGDLDLDGSVDVWTGGPGPNRLWLNDGTATFHEHGESFGVDETHASILVDLDGDGDLDIFDANAGANRVWRNGLR